MEADRRGGVTRKCVGCSRPAYDGRARCADCLESIRQARRRYVERNREKVLLSQKMFREHKIAAGLCSCGQPLAPNRKRCAECLERKRGYTNSRRARRQADGVCKGCGGERGENAYCDACLARVAEKSASLRSEVVAAYGGKCACCGESEPKFLQIDHIHNDGAEDRAGGLVTISLYRWLKRHGYPKDRFRLLCANCNLGRHLNGGICPHQSA